MLRVKVGGKIEFVFIADGFNIMCKKKDSKKKKGLCNKVMFFEIYTFL
jgi:hypothetical protein